MQRGFVYLTAVLDWATRRVLAWRLSNTLTADPWVEALEEAIRKYGAPEIMNTDRGSQFTSSAFVGVLVQNNIRISMDGKGCWRDNVFVERLWKSVKYEEVRSGPGNLDSWISGSFASQFWLQGRIQEQEHEQENETESLR
jgi:putative transposase